MRSEKEIAIRAMRFAGATGLDQASKRWEIRVPSLFLPYVSASGSYKLQKQKSSALPKLTQSSQGPPLAMNGFNGRRAALVVLAKKEGIEFEEAAVEEILRVIERYP